MATPTGLKQAEQCAYCHLAPEPSTVAGILDNEIIWLKCPCGRSVACGDEIAQAVKHWNKYVLFATIMIKGNPEPERRLR